MLQEPAPTPALWKMAWEVKHSPFLPGFRDCSMFCEFFTLVLAGSPYEGFPPACILSARRFCYPFPH